MIACLISLVVGVIIGLWAGYEESAEGIPADAAQFMLDGRGEF